MLLNKSNNFVLKYQVRFIILDRYSNPLPGVIEILLNADRYTKNVLQDALNDLTLFSEPPRRKNANYVC